MTWPVMVSGDSTEVVSHSLPQVQGWGSVNPSHLSTHHPPRIWLYSLWEGRGGSLTIVVWSWPSLSTGADLALILPWSSEATLTIWSERLAKDPYPKTPRRQWGSNPQFLECRSDLFINWAIVAPYFNWILLILVMVVNKGRCQNEVHVDNSGQNPGTITTKLLSTEMIWENVLEFSSSLRCYHVNPKYLELVNPLTVPSAIPPSSSQ